MFPQNVCTWRFIVTLITLIAFVWLFFRCMSAESLNCLYESIVALVALVWLFCCCVFSNMFSNYLHEKIYKHIGCICLTFPCCVFSNVSSKCGQIRSIFFQVCPAYSFLKGCTVTLVAFVFFCCVFWNVSSEKMHSLALAFVWLITGVCFQIFPQIVYTWRFIATLITLIAFL